jgi:putative solute:sodium symporter small subunit
MATTDAEPARADQAAGPARSLAWGPGETRLQRSAGVAAGPDHGYYQILIRSLIRAQLGLSLVCLAFALAVTASFPVLCAVLPALRRVTVLGLPLTLIALGAGAFPVILIIGAFYTRQAGRLERQFVKLMDRADGPPADD